ARAGRRTSGPTVSTRTFRMLTESEVQAATAFTGDHRPPGNREKPYALVGSSCAPFHSLDGVSSPAAAVAVRTVGVPWSTRVRVPRPGCSLPRPAPLPDRPASLPDRPASLPDRPASDGVSRLHAHRPDGVRAGRGPGPPGRLRVPMRE